MLLRSAFVAVFVVTGPARHCFLRICTPRICILRIRLDDAEKLRRTSAAKHRRLAAMVSDHDIAVGPDLVAETVW